MTPFSFMQGKAQLDFSPLVRRKYFVLEDRQKVLEHLRHTPKRELVFDSDPNSCKGNVARDYMQSIAYLRGELKMAQGKKGTVNKWVGFVNCELTAEDKATFKVWDVELDDAWDLLTQRVLEGYRLSFSHNPKNENFVVSLTGGDECGANAGYTLSGFGRDIGTALRVLCFKDTFILEGNWEQAKVAQKDDIG